MMAFFNSYKFVNSTNSRFFGIVVGFWRNWCNRCKNNQSSPFSFLFYVSAHFNYFVTFTPWIPRSHHGKFTLPFSLVWALLDTCYSTVWIKHTLLHPSNKQRTAGKMWITINKSITRMHRSSIAVKMAYTNKKN